MHSSSWEGPHLPGHNYALNSKVWVGVCYFCTSLHLSGPLLFAAFPSEFIHPLLSLPAQTGFHSHPPLSRLLLTQLLLPFFTSVNLSTSLHHPLTSNTNICCNSMFWPLPSCSCAHTHYVTLTYKKTCLIKESIVIFIHQVEWREVIYSHKYLLFGNYLHQSSGSLPTLLLETTFRIIQEERDRLDWFCPKGKGSKERGKKPLHTQKKADKTKVLLTAIRPGSKV